MFVVPEVEVGPATLAPPPPTPPGPTVPEQEGVLYLLPPPPPAKYLKGALGPGVPTLGLGLIDVPAPAPPTAGPG